MQPNTPQDDKFNYSAKQKVMEHYVSLSDRSTGPQSTGMSNVTHLIWPEAAFPFFLTHEADAMAQIADLLPEGAVLITGAVRPADEKFQSHQAYNSVYVIDHDGSILMVHDKVHLVPFGEYLPFQSLLERIGLQQLTKVAGGYLPGDRRRTYSIPRAPRMLPLVCYEIIFPGAAVPRDDRPEWVLNLTNDGWFGISSGPYQHFRQAQVRMIEEGLPLVRAANTGISAVVDPVGRVITRLPLGTEGVLDSGLPRSIAPTLYARAGDSLAGLITAIAFLIVIRRRTR
jgi:apolipoprotein N-acyltransferase